MIRIKPARKLRPPSPSEAQLHRVVSQFLQQAIRPPCFFTTFPAGGGGKARGGKLKAAGLRAGFPDIVVFVPCFGPTTIVIAIELKSRVGRLSPVQVATHDALARANVHCYIARSVDEVEAILAEHGVPLRARSLPLRARAA